MYPLHSMSRTTKSLITLACFALTSHAATAQDERPIESPGTTPCGVVAIPAEFDLGERPARAVHTQSIWLVNTCLEPVTIESARSTCGCTHAEPFEPFTLRPGDARSVDVTINIPKAGESRVVSMQFNADWGAPASTRFRMRGIESAPAAAMRDTAPADAIKDEGSVELLPTRAHLGDVEAAAPHDASAWLINNRDTAIRVDAIKAGCSCTEVIGFTPGMVAPGTAMRLRLRITPSAKSAGRPKSVKVNAQLADGTSMTTSVEMNVIAP